jgi:uncharacterized protein YdaU (DUF1376 family)
MQLYVSDFVGDTLHLTTEQIGAYMLILMAMWNAGGSLPADEAKIARVARLSVKKWRGIAGDIMPFFLTVGDEVSHNRLTKELQKSESKSQLRASAGAEGGRAKALKDKEARLANASILPQHLPDTITREDTPAKAVASSRALDLEPNALEQKLRDAAGEKIHPHAAFIVGPILELINAGCDLELDVIPTIRSKAAQLSQPARSWGYFTQAIRDSTDRRIAAGKLTSSPNSRSPPQRMTPYQQRHQSAIDVFDRKLGILPDDEFTGNTIDLGNADFQPH